MKRIGWWFVLAAVVLSLTVAAFPEDGGPRTPGERVTHLAKQIRCPTCAGRSVEESMAPLAVSSKQEITDRVQRGESDEQIRAFFVSRYGDTALMSPERTGLNSVPWILPGLFAIGGVGLAFFAVRRWRGEATGSSGPSDEDRVLVEAALRARS
jgi:cytochrome c-type biogenesis protein CcmH